MLGDVYRFGLPDAACSHQQYEPVPFSHDVDYLDARPVDDLSRHAQKPKELLGAGVVTPVGQVRRLVDDEVWVEAVKEGPSIAGQRCAQCLNYRCGVLFWCVHVR